MDNSFSHGLLYAVAPENLSELHLRDDEKGEEFEWEEKSWQFWFSSIRQAVLNLFIHPVAK